MGFHNLVREGETIFTGIRPQKDLHQFVIYIKTMNKKLLTFPPPPMLTDENPEQNAKFLYEF